MILAVATLLGFSGVERFVYFEMYATPVATASYAMAQNMGGDGELAGQFVVLSTVASVVTIFLWVYFLNSIGWLRIKINIYNRGTARQWFVEEQQLSGSFFNGNKHCFS